MKKEILFTLFIIHCVCIFGQNKIKYIYDDAGNQKERSIIILSKKLAESQYTDSIYTEVLAERKN